MTKPQVRGGFSASQIQPQAARNLTRRIALLAERTSMIEHKDEQEQERQVEPPVAERGTEPDHSGAGTIAGRVPTSIEANGAPKQGHNDGPKTGSRGADRDRETEEERER